ncbi:type II toxin-antitoxin system YafQ family toxin [Bacteroides sp. 519]|uniref:type II toxin-antitoxin system YafQ family toxin n=1 Tax=Bacteroides sp. 519 TaxID=2302937 RepID=UPI0013D4C8D4|nr:type II toxin-antitoxin system YafQ family toxin [Bacteroides sp. 519]NDV60336.1 type II toxin-antitoxin system YafQ family toxin [Bacteroides sp. 519]
MYEIEYTGSFKRGYKRCVKRGYDLELLFTLIEQLVETGTVPSAANPHKLQGDYAGCWECHIRPDWLLVWEVDDDDEVIRLLCTGTHSDLFG